MRRLFIQAQALGGAEAAGRTAEVLLASLNTVFTKDVVAEVDAVDITILEGETNH